MNDMKRSRFHSTKRPVLCCLSCRPFRSVQRIGVRLALVILAFAAGACAPTSRRTFNEPDVEYAYHTVMYQGETLALIAKWYTGQSSNWEILLDHNGEIDPRKLREGDLVKIPRELLIREEEMPRKFVVNAYAKPTAPKAVKAPTAEETSAAAAAAAPAAPVAEPPPSVDAAADAEAKNAARTKTRDQLLQELLEDQ